MKQYSQQSIHNIALLGHGGSGKTTLADAVLCYGKATERIGKIADSTTVMDFDPEEKKRKTSVSTSVYALELGGHKLNIIDAPGLFDFAGGVSEALAAADSAIIAVSGKSGLTSGAKQSFQKARALKKAVAFFVGKLDSTHAHFYRVISSLVANYGAVICPVVIPYIENDEVKSYIDLITNKAYACDGLELKELRMPVSNEADEMRSMLLEAIATADDALMEKYFAGEEFAPEEIIEGLKKGVASGEICPVSRVSSKRARQFRLWWIRCLKFCPPRRMPFAALRAARKKPLTKTVKTRFSYSKPLLTRLWVSFHISACFRAKSRTIPAL